MWRIPPPNQSTKPGDIAGGIRCVRGLEYLRIKIRGRKYSANRLAFLYIRGRWPRFLMDHQDGNTLNNRWQNLRECTHSQNAANRGANKNNKLGIKGVYLFAPGVYRAEIGINGKKIRLGLHKTPEAAAHAYRKAAKKYFGEFASW